MQEKTSFSMDTRCNSVRQAGLVCAVLVLCAAAFATTSKKAMKVTVIHASRFDVSPPLRDIPPAPPSEQEEEAEPPHRLPLSMHPLLGKDPLLQPPRPSAPAVLI